MLRNVIFAAAICASGAAQAQIKAEHPRFCVMSVGPTQMMFSAFQENRTDEIFCQHVPALGPTMIILDAKSEELRDMNIEVRVLKNIGQKDWRDDLDATTVKLIPAGRYLEKRGTTTFTVDLAKDGDYITLVRAMSDDGAKEYVGQYYFSAGESYEQALTAGGLAAAVGLVGVVIWRRNGGQKAAPKGQASPARRPAA